MHFEKTFNAFPSISGYQSVVILPLGAYLVMSRDIFGCHDWGKYYYHLVGRVAKLPTTRSPTTKNYLIQNVNTAEAEKPCTNAINKMDA